MDGQPDYGIDAPSVLAGYAIAGVAFLAAGLWAAFAAPGDGLLATLLRQGIWGGPLLLAGGVAHLWSSRVGKLREARRVVDSIDWAGHERVLDVGCGRALFLVEAAKHVDAGGAVGVDIWRRRDQSGNRPEAALQNAAREKVLDRVALVHGDARALPFADASFDVVLSGGALHNVHPGAARRGAVQEVVRVLRPGGRVAILDVAATAQYAANLRDAGMAEVGRRTAWPLWLLPARVVTGRKP